MILCLALMLTSCETTKLPLEYIVPSFSISRPERPILDSIPLDKTDAIRAFTVNLSRMNSYIKQLETYIRSQEDYHESIIRIIFNENN